MGFMLESTSAEKPQHPCKVYAKWKSGKYSYYDKVEGKDIDFEVPKKGIIVIGEATTVAWWNDPMNKAVWGNEIFQWNEPMVVKCWTETLMQWAYKDIKQEVYARKYEFNTNLYFVTKDEPDNIRCIVIRWPARSHWLDWTIKGSMPYANNFVEFAWTKDWKKGANKYVYPIYKVGEAFTPEDKEIQKNAAQKLFDYHQAVNEYYNNNAPIEDVVDEETELPF